MYILFIIWISEWVLSDILQIFSKINLSILFVTLPTLLMIKFISVFILVFELILENVMYTDVIVLLRGKKLEIKSQLKDWYM